MTVPYRRLGRTGALVSPLALGTDNILNPTPEDESSRMIIRALDAGINLIDTSDSYRAGDSERVIGGAAPERAAGRSGDRHQGALPDRRWAQRSRQLATALMRACEQSLRRLQTDRIDLYQLHRPDFDVPIDETLGALDLVRQGRFATSAARPHRRGRSWRGCCSPSSGLGPVRHRPAAVQPAGPPRRERSRRRCALQSRPRVVALVAAGDGHAARSARLRDCSRMRHRARCPPCRSSCCRPRGASSARPCAALSVSISLSQPPMASIIFFSSSERNFSVSALSHSSGIWPAAMPSRPFEPLEDMAEHLVELVEVALVLHQRGAREVVELLHLSHR